MIRQGKYRGRGTLGGHDEGMIRGTKGQVGERLGI